MTYQAPGRHEREGISLFKIFRLFPNDHAAEQWFIEQRWPDGVVCLRCRSTRVNTKAKHPSMPFLCRDCGNRFSVRMDTPMQSSKLGYQVWMVALYLFATSLKGVSSMKLHRDLNITQKTAWFLAHRIRESWRNMITTFLTGPIEVDEAFFGGKEDNKHASKKLQVGGGTAGKTPVVGIKDRDTNQIKAKVIERIDKKTLQGFVKDNIAQGTDVYTDDALPYKGLKNHKSVKHSVGEYVNGKIHTNGMESFWSLLKRGYYGTYHKMSKKHLQRYVYEFAGRHNNRPYDTLDQIKKMMFGMVGKRLKYVDLIDKISLKPAPVTMADYCTATEDDELPF